MSKEQATAAVFKMAFDTMPRKEKVKFFESVLRETKLRKEVTELLEDLHDSMIIESRRHEKSRPFREYLAEKEKQKSGK